MSAMQQMLLGGDGLRFIKTVVTATNSGFIGQGTGIGGSSTTISGALTPYTNCRLASLSGSFDFNVSISGSSAPPADVLVGVNVWDESNVKRTYLFAAATTSTSALCTNPTRSWSWGSGSSVVWSSVGITRRVEFF